MAREQMHTSCDCRPPGQLFSHGGNSQHTRYHVGQKLHLFIFSITLSNHVLCRYFLAHIYLNKFPILIFFVDSSTENQLNNRFVYTIADDNYLRKFIMLYSKEDWNSK